MRQGTEEAQRVVGVRVGHRARELQSVRHQPVAVGTERKLQHSTVCR